MANTASPAVSVIVPLIARAELVERAGRQLREQTLSDIEIILVGGEAGAVQPKSLRADERVRREAPGLAPVNALNAGLDTCRGERVVIFDPRDEIEPTALEALAVRMRHGGDSGAFGGYRFRAPIGDLPQDPLAEAPDTVGLDELLACQWFPLSAMMVDRSVIGSVRFRSALAASAHLLHPADLDWLLRLAELGAHWSRSRIRVASIWTRELRPPDEILSCLQSRAAVVRSFAQCRFAREIPDDAARAERVADLAQGAVDAYVGLVSQRENPPSSYCVRTLPEGSMARWWQRLSFAGSAPKHLRPAAMLDTTHETKREPTTHELMRSLLECLSPAKPVVLVGSADATRHPGWLLASMGCPLRVLDASGEGVPRWAAEEKIEISLLRDPALAPPNSQFVVAEEGTAFTAPEGFSVLTLADALRAFRERKIYSPRLGPGGEMPGARFESGVLDLPRLIATYLAEQVPTGSTAVLLGLGRNARRLARLLHRRGISIVGLDDSLNLPPDWVADDGVPLRMLRSREEFPAAACFIMTVQRDEAFLRSLPAGLRVARWSRVGEVLSGVATDSWYETASQVRQAA